MDGRKVPAWVLGQRRIPNGGSGQVSHARLQPSWIVQVADSDQSFRGWKLRAPPHSRLPIPLEAVALISMNLSDRASEDRVVGLPYVPLVFESARSLHRGVDAGAISFLRSLGDTGNSRPPVLILQPHVSVAGFFVGFAIECIDTHVSLELTRTCEDLRWNHGTSTPYRSETHGMAERAVRRVTVGTASVQVQSGLSDGWWSDAMECY